jgi:hypothetical protein
MNADERDWLSEELRDRLEARRPALEFLVSTLRMSKDAEDLDYIGRRLVAEAWAKRAGEHSGGAALPHTDKSPGTGAPAEASR